jgi:NADH:ubiquinone oxidoreductase subunit 2 (subunit N)
MNMAAPLFFVLYFGFWAWMVVECAAFEKGRFTKLAWLVFLVPCGPIVGVVYYLVRILPRVIHETADEKKAAA